MLKRTILPLFLAAMFLLECQAAAAKSLDDMPPLILWAWERPEDLRFLDGKNIGVAFLAQTLQLNGDGIVRVPRRQPLKVSPSTPLMAVTRIENAGEQPAALSSAQRQQLVATVLTTLALKNVTAVQIDYDAKVSERGFYRQFLIDLRRQLPADMPLSMTALASFCLGDPWINDLPVDEAVPMVFRMGADTHQVRQHLINGNDFALPLCRQSVGIATDEPLPKRFAGRRVYVFKGVRAVWIEQDLEGLLSGIR
ncbi:hypothetical protein JCM14076_01680 [Methylosoma difficile]